MISIFSRNCCFNNNNNNNHNNNLICIAPVCDKKTSVALTVYSKFDIVVSMDIYNVTVV